MRKILMRAHMSPFDNFNAFHVVENNCIGTNAGNMIFPYSACKTLHIDDETTIDCIRTDREITAAEIEVINAEYDCFVIPLANAFRQLFLFELKALTKLIENLTIPCIVLGVGLQAPIDAKKGDRYPFDYEVKEFVKSVLKKSALIGLRGEITGAYLKNLGFCEGKDYSVIGCISMYMLGRKLPALKHTNLNKDSIFSFNRKPDLPKNFHNFIEKCIKELPNSYFIPQNLFDFRLLFSGVPLSLTYDKKVPPNFPQTADHQSFINDRVRGFINVPSWLEFLKGVDFSFGSRIHGNILPILAGTPSFIFVPDARILELARYHNIPHMIMNDIKKETSILDIYEKTDFSVIHEGHEQRFDKYVDFLNANGLEHVFDGKRDYDSLPFDKRMARIDFYGPIKPLYTCTSEEQALRLKAGQKFIENMKKPEPVVLKILLKIPRFFKQRISVFIKSYFR